MNFLLKRPESEVRSYTRRLLEECMPGGGYALGSKNSIADYVKADNYMAMLEEGLRWGRWGDEASYLLSFPMS